MVYAAWWRGCGGGVGAGVGVGAVVDDWLPCGQVEEVAAPAAEGEAAKVYRGVRSWVPGPPPTSPGRPCRRQLPCQSWWASWAGSCRAPMGRSLNRNRLPGRDREHLGHYRCAWNPGWEESGSWCGSAAVAT